MFIPVAFSSINSQADLEPGAYRTSRSLYRDAPDGLRVLLFEYCSAHRTEDVPSAYDVMIVEPGGLVRVRDFVWLADRSWRDSDGLKSNNVMSLMPAELMRLPCVRTQRLDDAQVGRAVHARRG